jgi:hypothetical protein
VYEGGAGGWVVAGELLHGLLYWRLSDAVGGCVGDTACGDYGLGFSSAVMFVGRRLNRINDNRISIANKTDGILSLILSGKNF